MIWPILAAIFLYFALATVLWGVSRFIQGVFYETVPESLWWRGAAGAGIIWFVAIAWPGLFRITTDGPWPITFDELFLFKGTTAATTRFKELIVVDGPRQTSYLRTTNARGNVEFRDAEQRPLPSTPLTVIVVSEEGGRRRLDVVKDSQGFIDRSGAGARYRDEEGNVVAEDVLLTGEEAAAGSGAVFFYLFVGLVLWGTWFLVLWLLMLFQWPHALLISVPAVLIWTFAMNFVF